MKPTPKHTAKRLCSVFKSPKRAEMYLYVDRMKKLDELPEMLLETFGTPIPVIDIILTENKKLARADAGKVLSEIEEKGFYLQLPPQPETESENSYPMPGDILHG